MDRNDVLSYLNTNRITSSLAVEMVVDFARSKGKTTDELSILVKIITEEPGFLTMALGNSISYFLSKYNINSISKGGRIINYF